MAILQEGLLQIKREYIFPIIEKKVLLSQKKDLLNLGIGDIALPLAEPIGDAFLKAIQTMQKQPIGYPPSFGHPELIEAIYQRYYQHTPIDPSDIFISDGINSDLGNLQELFDPQALIGIADPTYPVPLDACIMAGRAPFISLLNTDASTQFLPTPPDHKLDVVYLCTPSNPSGSALTKSQLERWVNWAIQHKAILIIDAAYADFIQDDDVPKSIYEIEGARDVAIELRSFSKSAGFTALRCSYSVVPSSLKGVMGSQEVFIKPLWAKRMATKSNGVSYPIQKAALAALQDEGYEATRAQVKHYLSMSARLNNALTERGFSTTGARNAPYVFVKCPPGFNSWEFFDFLLDQFSIVSVPGLGFGKNGEGYIRLSGFITEEVCIRACERLAMLSCLI